MFKKYLLLLFSVFILSLNIKASDGDINDIIYKDMFRSILTKAIRIAEFFTGTKKCFDSLNYNFEKLDINSFDENGWISVDLERIFDIINNKNIPLQQDITVYYYNL